MQATAVARGKDVQLKKQAANSGKFAEVNQSCHGVTLQLEFWLQQPQKYIEACIWLNLQHQHQKTNFGISQQHHQ